MRSKTCSTIAAAPLRPPPSALFRAPLRSNCEILSDVCGLRINQLVSDTDIDILGVDPPLDEDSEQQCRQYGPQYAPEPPTLGAL